MASCWCCPYRAPGPDTAPEWGPRCDAWQLAWSLMAREGAPVPLLVSVGSSWATHLWCMPRQRCYATGAVPTCGVWRSGGLGAWGAVLACSRLLLRERSTTGGGSGRQAWQLGICCVLKVVWCVLAGANAPVCECGRREWWRAVTERIMNAVVDTAHAVCACSLRMCMLE
jgi:hypothetical protein